MQKLPAKKINHVLPPLRDVPVALAALTPLEQRLVAMAKVDQVLIDKLPSGGRMYIVGREEAEICPLFASSVSRAWWFRCTFGNLEKQALGD